ncbi:MAG: phosphate acyltransferase PlsX [bacterium]|nr:phosphate acyltransferase PlsX [bacterium]MCP4799826.1 phosphate acyltransferase PlsX [bacterium]
MVDQDKLPVVAVDAMGGDIGPSAVVPGVVDALSETTGYSVALYGDKDSIQTELNKLDCSSLPISIVHCTQAIEMGDSPASAVKGKPDSPIVKAMTDHKAGIVSAVMSAGSTGAMVAASLMILGRLSSVKRPGIATVIPTSGKPFVMLDSGANVQATPEHLETFAKMGDTYCKSILGNENPTVGLLNIGEEPSKGSELTVAAHKLLAESNLNFVGNIESKQLPYGPVDVLVTDGFTGNIVLKMVEGFGALLIKILSGSKDSKSDDKSAMLEKMDYSSTGGAMLLGVKGSSIICHGASNSRAIKSALVIASRLALVDLPTKLEECLSDSN